MQASSSSLTANQDLESFVVVSVEGTKAYSTSVGGRKSEKVATEELVADVVAVSSDEFSSDEASLKGYDGEEESEEEDYDSEEEEEEDEEEEEIEEFFAERARIRKDALELKKLAGFYLHPERSVVADASATARCFFDRVTDEVTFEDEEKVERARILAEAKALKESAVMFQHPEAPLKVHAAACARTYFHRYTADEAVSREEADERARILADAVAMRKLAMDYAHPEHPVVTTDATVFGRNCFERASAAEQETDEQDMEREDVLEDMAELKRLAVTYLHPERPIVTTDASVFGRNYFQRASAPEQEDLEQAEERARILADVAALKQSATCFMHPEIPVVTTDASACGRNYFTRASAPEYEEEEDEEERSLVLKEAQALKQWAVFYTHPEVSVTTTDSAACGRNYFTRASAPQDEEDEQRDQIMQDMAALKKHAAFYMHPELPLEVDAAATSRNYFTRASAAEQVDEDDGEEQELILRDMAALKKLAQHYKHPENQVEVDSTACARSYFSRFSAVEQERSSDSEERARVLAEVQALKKNAVEYRHPELPLVVDATASARSYFTRPSAPMPEGVADMEERARVLEEAKALKKSAVDFMHPELPLLADATATARNYFARPSAPDQESLQDAKERARVLLEAKALAKLAENYLHPELPLASDAKIQGRNYFNRASAPGVGQYIYSTAADLDHDKAHDVDGEELSHHDHDYGHFDMDEDAMFADMRQSLVAPLGGGSGKGPKFQSGKFSSDEEGELSRSPSSVMLFSGVDPESDNLRLPSMT